MTAAAMTPRVALAVLAAALVAACGFVDSFGAPYDGRNCSSNTCFCEGDGCTCADATCGCTSSISCSCVGDGCSCVDDLNCRCVGDACEVTAGRTTATCHGPGCACDGEVCVCEGANTNGACSVSP